MPLDDAACLSPCCRAFPWLLDEPIASKQRFSPSNIPFAPSSPATGKTSPLALLLGFSDCSVLSLLPLSLLTRTLSTGAGRRNPDMLLAQTQCVWMGRRACRGEEAEGRHTFDPRSRICRYVRPIFKFFFFLSGCLDRQDCGHVGKHPKSVWL